MRKKIVAGNWKMNMTLADGEALVEEIMSKSPAKAQFLQVYSSIDRSKQVFMFYQAFF
jgi:triosephosphate isomerase